MKIDVDFDKPKKRKGTAVTLYLERGIIERVRKKYPKRSVSSMVNVLLNKLIEASQYKEKNDKN